MELVAQARVIYGGTYNSSSLVTSAMVATMKQLSQPGFYEQLSLAGETLAQGLVELVRRVGLPATYSGVGPLFQLWFCEPDRLPRDYREARPILQRSPFHTFWQEMMARGVILHPQQSGLFLISAAHSLADIERTLDLAEAVMPAVKRAFEKMNG
jgi:glutamate-1-semialdehyde 2,1-aminomutase